MDRITRLLIRGLVVLLLISCPCTDGASAEAGAPSAQSGARLLDRALTLMGAGMYREAEATCRKVLATCPDSAGRARLTLGEVYFRQGRFAEAIAEAEKVYGLTESSGVGGHLLLDVWNATRRWQAAEAALSKSIAELSKRVSSGARPATIGRDALQIVDLLRQAGKTDEATEQCLAVMRDYPWSGDALLDAADKRISIGGLGGGRGASPARPLAEWQAEALGRTAAPDASALEEIRAKCREVMAQRPGEECAVHLTLAEAFAAAGFARRARQESLRAFAVAVAVPEAASRRRVFEARNAIERFALGSAGPVPSTGVRIPQEADEALRRRLAELARRTSSGGTLRYVLEAQIQIVDALLGAGLKDEAARRCWEMLSDHQARKDAVWQATGRLAAVYLNQPAAGGVEATFDRGEAARLAAECQKALADGTEYEAEVRLLLAQLRCLLGEYAEACREGRAAYASAGGDGADPSGEVGGAALAVLAFSEAGQRLDDQVVELERTVAATLRLTVALRRRLSLGGLKLKAGRAPEAVDEYYKVITADPSSRVAAASAARGMEEACSALGLRIPEGDARFDGAGPLADAIQHMREGRLLHAAGLAEAVAESPDAAYEAHLLLSELRYLSGRFASSAHEALKALEVAAQSASSPVNMATAAQAFVRAADADAEVVQPLGKVLAFALGERASAVYEEALLTHLGQPGVVYFAASRLRALHLPGASGSEVDSAAGPVETADGLQPALEHLRGGRYDEAIRACQQLVEAGAPATHEARLLLSEAYGRAGRADDARRVVVEALQEAIASKDRSREVEAALAVSRAVDRGATVASQGDVEDAVAPGGPPTDAGEPGDPYGDEIKRLHEAGDYGMALVLMSPRYLRAVGRLSVRGDARTYGAFLTTDLLLHRHLRDAMAEAVAQERLTAASLRDVALRAFRRVRGMMPPGSLRFPDVPAEDAQALGLFEDSLLRGLESRMIEDWRLRAQQLPDEELRTVLADYVAAQLLLTRADGVVLAETIAALLGPAATTAVLAEFASFASAVGRNESATALLGQAAAACEDPALAAPLLMEQANALLAAREVGRAIEGFRRVAKDYATTPEAPAAQMQVARLLASEWKSYEAAAAECEELRKAFPDSKEALEADFLRGQYYYLGKSYDQAIVALEDALERHSQRRGLGNARVLLALSHMGRGDSGRAVTILEGVAADGEDSAAPRAQYLIGYSHLSGQDYEEALAAFRELKRRFPGSDEAAKAERIVQQLERAAAARPGS